MHRRHDHGQRHFADLPPSTLLAGGLFTTVVLLAAGCATQAGPDETPAAANPTTSSPATTPTSPSTMSAPTPTSTSVTVAATTATPTELGAAVCYYTTDLDKPDNSTGVAFGYKDGEENVISVENLVYACHDSLVRMGKIYQADSVAACVLENGQVGVMPGTGDVCTTLNLPVADAAASAPLPDPNH